MAEAKLEKGLNRGCLVYQDRRRRRWRWGQGLVRQFRQGGWTDAGRMDVWEVEREARLSWLW